MLRARTAVCTLILIATVAGVAVSAAVFDARIVPSSPMVKDEAENAFNTQNLIRLHVVANSDADADQDIKLKVRDAVLARTKGLLGSATTKEEAWRVLLEDASEIEAVALECVRAAGKSYGVTVEMGTFPFPERTYGAVSVPRGDYDAVRVVLGAGEGHNWWCVLFPPLCFIEVNRDEEVEGLALQLSPGEALARLRLDFSSASPAGGAGIPVRPWPEGTLASAPPFVRWSAPAAAERSLSLARGTTPSSAAPSPVSFGDPRMSVGRGSLRYAGSHDPVLSLTV